ncbi:MAG: radical SAM protein [Ruminococcaceae bacterium]|nr:radical SAM protein [Oscillospiraceae bacterium]
MNIQSLSVCVPANKCINNCRFCCSQMHDAEYRDYFSDISNYAYYSTDMRKRLEYARENGCNTCMLTGNNEPQQNKAFLRVFSEINKSLRAPFLNIEMQTTGAFIDAEFLDFFKTSVGLTTIAISVACLDDDEANRDMIRTGDTELCLATLCKEIKKKNINLRLCLNMNDRILLHHSYTPETIIELCSALGADQITFRALWAPDIDCEQSRWIEEHVTAATKDFIEELNADILKNGRYLDTLEYGADRFDYHGFSVVVDDDSMSQKENKSAVKYLILRPDGHLYSKWDSKASLIF